jgi:hypothetical protein
MWRIWSWSGVLRVRRHAVVGLEGARRGPLRRRHHPGVREGRGRLAAVIIHASVAAAVVVVIVVLDSGASRPRPGAGGIAAVGCARGPASL